MTDAPVTPPGWYADPNSAVMRWWDGSRWTEQFAPAPQQQVVVVPRRGTNHIFHLLMSLVTLGLWLPVWLIVAISNRNDGR